MAAEPTPPALPQRPRVIIGVIGDDIHIVGNRIMQLALEESGCRVFNLRTRNRPEHFVPGPLTRAMQAGGILYLEEMNRAPSGALNVLMTALSERYLEIPRLGRVEAKPGFTVVGAANPLDDVGTTRLSRGLVDRFVTLELDYQTREDELLIVVRRCGSERAGNACSPRPAGGESAGLGQCPRRCEQQCFGFADQERHGTGDWQQPVLGLCFPGAGLGRCQRECRCQCQCLGEHVSAAVTFAQRKTAGPARVPPSSFAGRDIRSWVQGRGDVRPRAAVLPCSTGRSCPCRAC